MATLLNTKPSETYKDLLTVASGTLNQGLENSIKQVFDGDGIGSPMWLSTALLQVGVSGSTANVSVYGNVITYKVVLRNASDEQFDALSTNDAGEIFTEQPFVTKSSVTFQKSGAEDLVMDATTGSMQRGDGSKGNIKLGDTEVTLQKGSTNLLTAKADGTIQFQNITSENAPTPAAGDMAMIDDSLYIGV